MRSRLIERKIEIESISKMVDKLLAEGETYLELMKQNHLEGNFDSQKWKILFENFEAIQKQQNIFFKRRDDLNAIQQREHLSFTKLCTDKFFSISQFIPPTLLSVRKELELPLDEKTYLENFNSHLNTGRIALDSFFKEVEQKLNCSVSDT